MLATLIAELSDQSKRLSEAASGSAELRKLSWQTFWQRPQVVSMARNSGKSSERRLGYRTKRKKWHG